MNSIHENMMIVDDLCEGVDWFKLIYEESKLEIAKRVKSTPTKVLTRLVCGDGTECNGTQKIQLDFATRELLHRKANGDLHEDGDPKFKDVFAGYDKINRQIHEKLTADDSAEDWISDFVASSNPKFDGKSKKERIRMALGAYYAATKKDETLEEKRALRILELATAEKDQDLLRLFYESDKTILKKSALQIHDLYESFAFNLLEAPITIGSKAKVKFLNEKNSGKVFEGIWKLGGVNQLRLHMTNLPEGANHPTIIFDRNTKQVNTSNQFELL